MPYPKITWTKNGEIVEEDEDILRIGSTTKEDVGTYACNASNLAGYAYKMVYLNFVTLAPYFLESPM